MNKNGQKKIKHIDLIIIGIYIILCTIPIIYCFIDGISELVKNTSQSIDYLIPTGRTALLFVKSIGYSITVGLLDIIVAVLFASIIFYINLDTIYFKILFLCLSVLPPYIHALSWSDTINALNNIFNLNISLRGWGISIFVQALYFLPLAILFIIISFESINEELILSARVLRNDSYVFLRVIVPCILSYAFTALGVIFALSMMDYTIPSLFGVNIYSLQTYTIFSSGSSEGQAMLASLPVLIITIMILIPFRNKINEIFLNGTSKNINQNNYRFKYSRGYNFIISLSIVIVLLQVLVPIITIIFDIGMWKDIKTSFTQSWSEIGSSFGISLLAVLISLPISYVLSQTIIRQKTLGSIIFVLLIIQLAIPSSLSGISMISLWNRILPDFLYYSIVPVAVVQMTRFLPITTLALASEMNRINHSLLEAATILEKRDSRILFKIKLPMLKKVIISSSILMFMLCFGELGATLLVIPPGVSTLTIKIYNYLHYGSTETVKGLCFLVLALCILPALIITINIKRRKST